MAQPFADVGFRNDPGAIQRQPTEVRIRLKEYMHDVAVITIDYDSGGQKKYAYGAPVEITWGYLPSDIESFLGFVHHTKTIMQDKKPRQLQVFCVGASYRWNKTRQRSYQKLMVGSILSRIAREHKFALVADPSSRYHWHIPQLGQSDWALAVRLAKDIGFTLNARQTTVQFKRRIIDTRPGRQPMFRLLPGVYNQRGALYRIEHKQGSAPLAERAVIQVDGLDDNGNIVTMTDSGDCCDPVQPIFTKFVPDAEPIRSIHEGRELLSGLSGMNRFYVIAKAWMSGDPRVRPGMSIGIEQTDKDVDGYWWVGGVDHVITPGSYTMELEIGRETIYQTSYVPVPTSDSGKPAIFAPDDMGVEYYAEPSPESEYNPLDDCIPVENMVTDPFGDSVSAEPDPFESDARRQMRERRPRPSRRRGCCPENQAVPVVPVARLNGWRATRSMTRVT